MPRTTRSAKKSLPPAESSDEDEPKAKPVKPKNQKNPKKVVQKRSTIPSVPKVKDNDSSSESDLDTYLKPADQIDLTSSFFDVHNKPEENAFEAIENNIFAGINRLSESETESENENNTTAKPTSGTNKINFQQLHEYTKKIEEAKKVVEKYEARRKSTLAKNKKNKRAKEHSNTSISDLLAKGEAKAESVQDASKSLHSSDFESFSDSEKEWEEVEERELKEHKTVVPKEGVQITVELPDVMRKKKGVDLVASMKRRLNRIRKENQVYVHKVHLLCWISHGNYVNTVLNNEHLLALAMSLLPSQHCYPSERTDLSYLESVVKWFSGAIPVIDKIMSKNLSLDKALRLQINRKQAYNKKMLVYIFICMMRALGIQCRLVLSFVVSPLRPPAEELHSLSSKHNDVKPTTNKNKDENIKSDSKKSTPVGKEQVASKQNVKEPPSSSATNKNSKESLKVKHASKNEKGVKDENKKEPPGKTKENKAQKDKRKETINVEGKHPEKTAKYDSKSTINKDKQVNKARDSKHESKKPNFKNLTSSSQTESCLKRKKNSSKSDKAKLQILQVDGVNDSDSEPATKTQKPNLKKLTKEDKNSCHIKKHPKRLKKLPSYADIDSEDDFEPKGSSKPVNLQRLKKAQTSTNISTPKNDVRNDIVAIMKGRMAEERSAQKSKLVKRKSNASDYDSDYAPEPVKKRHHDSDDELYETTKVKVKRRVQVKQSDDKDDKKKKGVDVWVEVYLENEEKWISVDVSKGEVHCVNQLYARASHPVTYVIAWNNNNSVKDISQRYCPNWNTVTRKLRIDKKWWDASLKPFGGTKTIRDKEEDEELARLQLEQPLPKSITEYKDHPLYALKRHLLKFQAIYPPDSVILGFVRTEPVYARDCVHTLHSRETWLKHAKVVRLAEKPYKIVKARPKYDKLSGQCITDLPLEVFGKWQVDDYIPPTAKDGVVPRNAYGNVELFKACMLPKGTVHLQLPGLNKVAKKMNIDCVPAVVGFDIHSGWTHPTFDGFVVCEEFSESLIAAWYIEQEEQEKRDLEKLEKRVYDNWKKLIRGLLIRERLKARYDYGAPSQSDAKNKKRKNKGPKLVTKKRRICSESESD